MKLKKVVILGGGLGASTFTAALKDLPIELTTIVSAYDNGGSTGLIRRDYGGFAVGDFRNCLLAASGLPEEAKQALNFRFAPGHLYGAQVGNVVVKAVMDTSRNFTEANQKLRELFQVNQTILPISLDEAELVARLSNGGELVGQNEIADYLSFLQAPIQALRLSKTASILPAAKKAIEEADVVLFAPGHFFTSLLPNVYTEGFKEAWKKSRAKKYWFVNLLAHKGQDSFYTLKDYVVWFQNQLGNKSFHAVVVNKDVPPKALAQVADRFEKLRVTPKDKAYLGQKGIEVQTADLVSPQVRAQGKNDPIARAPLVHDVAKIKDFFERYIY